MYDLIVIGSGAAGVFSSIIFKENNRDKKVLILEKSSDILQKVKISGGGRCNVTNFLLDPKDLIKNYPRGSKELLSCFYRFSPKDLIKFFEDKKVFLKVEQDNRVFPKSNSSQSIIDCFLDEVKNLNIEIKKNQDILKIKKEDNFFKIDLKDQTFISKNLLIATGSNKKGYEFIKELNHTIIDPIPSLFTFNVKNFSMKDLSGIAIKNVNIKIKDSLFSHVGDLLITHFGFSGPCTLKLSSFAARYIYEKKYMFEISINYVNQNFDKVLNDLKELKNKNKKEKLFFNNLFDLPKNLFKYFLKDLKIFNKKLNDISNKDLINLASRLTNDKFSIDSKTLNKQEFVTCGGVNLKEIDFKTMQSKTTKNLFFAGEVIDIDGITGGFNFQNAFTTAYIAAISIK
jgi:hypothetical protein